MPRRKKTEPQSAPRALWPGSLKQPLCLYRHGRLLSGSNGRAKRAPHMLRFVHRAAPRGGALCFLRPQQQRLGLCGLCREDARCAGRKRPFQARCRKKASPPGRQFCAQPPRLPSTAAEGASGKLPCPASKATVFGMLRSFGPAVLDERCVKKAGNPSGLPAFFDYIRCQDCQPKPVFSCASVLFTSGFIFLQ